MTKSKEEIEAENQVIYDQRLKYRATRRHRYITGYHGTTHACARKIESSNTFLSSDEPNHWLGKGIYFYKYFSDAAIWESEKSGKSQEVIHVVVKVDENGYLDMEKPAVLDFLEEIAYIAAYNGIEDIPTDTRERQFRFMNYLWDSRPQIKVVGAKFPAYKNLIGLNEKPATNGVIDFRKARREFCVRDNSYILNKTYIKDPKI